MLLVYGDYMDFRECFFGQIFAYDEPYSSGKYYSLLDTTAQYLVYAPREKVLLSGYFSSY